MNLVWVAGTRTPVTEGDWADTAATFLGAGYRMMLPIVPDRDGPVRFHRKLAQKVALTLGARFDPAPWQYLATNAVPVGAVVEVIGGWPSTGPPEARLDDSPPWTAIVELAPAPHDAAYRRGVTLPWASNPHSPTTGLPMLSRLDEQQAGRYLRKVGATVGLWMNTTGNLSGSTAGVPLIPTGKRSWVFPDRSAGIVSNWVFWALADALSALPQSITADVLGSTGTVAAISGAGAVTVLTSLDDHELSPDHERVLDLLAARLKLLG